MEPQESSSNSFGQEIMDSRELLIPRSLQERVQAAASEVLMHAYANRHSGQIHIDMSERNSGDSSRAPEILDEDGEEAGHGTNDTERARAQFARLRQTISQNEGAQTICTYFATLVPFVILFALKVVIDNYGDLIRLITGIFCFIICDGYIQAVVAAGRPSFQQRATMTVGLVIGLIAASNTIAPVEDYNIWKMLSFQYAGDSYHGFTYTLLIIVLTDNFVKLVTVLVKLIIVMLPFISLHQKRRNFQSTEYISQFYRSIIPAIQWVYYFLGDNPDSYAIVDVGLASTYMGLKCRETFVIGTVMYQSIRRLFEVSNYGVTPTSAEIEEAGMCSICHDRLASPTKLSCSHMFCHSCIDTWLDKEHTCPMCRAVIDKQDNDFKTGATSKLVRFY